MKYKDIVGKASAKPKSDYKVVVGDTAEKIELEAKVSKMSLTKDELDLARKEISSLKEEVVFLRTLSSDQQASMYELGKNFSNEIDNLEDYAVMKEKFERLSQDFLQVETSYTETTQLKNKLEKELTNRETNDTLFNLSIEKLKTEVRESELERVELSTSKIALQDRVTLLEENSIELKNTIDSQSTDLVKVQTDKTDLDIEHNKLLENHKAVKKTNTTNKSRLRLLEKQKDDVDDQFAAVNSTAKTIANDLKQKSSDLELVTNQYNELRKDSELLWKHALKLQKEVRKPRYASLSSIERNEGFSLPRNLKAPKNSLGSGKPTLLKVRGS
tara:strand:- start:307 stop:1296 length:990 start_codon:yes stop_codon:yes gene_type:complete